MLTGIANSISLLPLAAVDRKAVSAFPHIDGLSWITNSMVVSVLVMVFILVLARLVSKDLKKVPTGAQNLAEAFIETLYNFIESIVGKSIAPRAFPLLATFFFFFLFANWFGLLPGVGTVGVYHANEAGVMEFNPLLRPTAADLNAGIGIALVFFVLWLVISIQETGVKGFFAHLFAPKGKSANKFMMGFLALIFLFVGCLEVISISIRQVSLPLRIYGNVFAGENLLHEMSALGYKMGLNDMVAWAMAAVVPIPFFFLEILVGFLQAVVFTLLCAVYIQLSTTHDEEHH
ncbi:F0F1 ATP synthase subunit A [Sulfuriroseicoccus oceanibius]|uniref:ATP synthase subunit a n=1 Tax=Sulfuriroseicoccus oceanibius TaxID=2707525 RepID=A0A6B3L1G4_9BACT|nr:F0F1 ATP synthase subunit A [Sulfuriroseicoccus oceanibius]QQL43878.1 F0F1 ATP synthase subunit A [Sulfuriroseicoccus oceanibius]